MGATVKRLSGASSGEDISKALEDDGVVIVEDFLAPDLVAALNEELQPHIEACKPRELKSMYDGFLGAYTVRLHAIADKSESFVDVLVDPRILSVMDQQLKPNCTDYRLSSAELIEIRGGEAAQPIHRDDDSWPRAAQSAAPLAINVMIALSDYTAENGATVVVPGSHKWARDREPTPEETTQAVMSPGSAAIFTGQTIHGGGRNVSGVPRRGLSVSYCHGWLVPVENSWLGVPLEKVRKLPKRAQSLLGYDIYDGTSRGGGQINMYEVGSPRALLGG
ncbi:phytanoyl-CoA dioxygenase family protein [Henriciella aquimarina]|uniref:phytanoyl-CoA dioxygenase family protein n=1 Tax=Henriciella aquimarina TaxID=545261 RepID=UPI000A02D77E|nr:phytanoyl-CoA dioxygenase family protein [Henriciella aquimarina]